MFLRRRALLSTTPLISSRYSKISRRFLAAVTPRRPTNKAPHSTVYPGDLKPTVSNLLALNCKVTQVSRLSTTPAFETPRSQNSRATMDAVEAVLTGKYPAKEHARRVVEYIKKKNPDATGVLYLEGQKTRMIEDNDESMPFRYLHPTFPVSILTKNSTKTATILLLHDWLRTPRCLFHIRYRNRQKHALHPTHRPGIRNLVRPPAL